jgi:sarcosine oxidase subunit gamma
MAEHYQQQSALAHFGLAARATSDQNDPERGIRLGEREFYGQINLRGDPRKSAFMDAVFAVTGCPLPTKPNTSSGPENLQIGPRPLWLAPGEWLVVTSPGTKEEVAKSLADVTAGCGGAVTDVSDARTVIALSGQYARDVLMKGCSLDLHPAAFIPGRCAQSLLARATVILYHGTDPVRVGESVFEIYVARSFADYLWRWLEDAASEYGVQIIEG